MGVAAPSRGVAQVDDVQRSIGHSMLNTIHYYLDSLYFDSTYGGRDHADLWWQGRRDVDRATSMGAMLGAIAQSLQTLQDSHTRFLPPGITVDADYGWRWTMVGEDCYAAAVDRKSDAYRKGLRVGDRVLLIDRNVPTRRNLSLIGYVYHDLSPVSHMRLTVEHPDGRQEEILLEAKLRHRAAIVDPSDLETSRQLGYAAEQASHVKHRWHTEDSVAVWAMSGFGVEDRRIDDYMNRARHFPWLVLDLRGNPGGALEGVDRLLGHFFDTSFVAFTQQYRDSTTADTVTPRGDGPYRGHVIVLLDSESASSSEIVAWILQHDAGATVIGDRSSGAVRGSIMIPLAVPGHAIVPYGLQLSLFDVVMPDGTHLEGAGITPDRPVLPLAIDLAEGRDPVLQAALDLAAGR
jgi:C-terminal processing protease CtpA/Prc